MKKTGSGRLVAATITVALCTGLVMRAAADDRTQAGRARVPVLAELFTSEGCSSCPVADDLLRRLIAEQPVEGVEVIALSQHVDYWNRLGWRDPYSSARFTQRQSEYAAALGAGQSYTPQLVVDGRLGMVGSDWPQVRQSLVDAAREPRATLTVSATQLSSRAASVRTTMTGLPDFARTGRIRVMVAIIEDNLVTEVTRGENARRRLRHDAVVRVLDTIGTVGKDAQAGEFAKEIELDPAWAVKHLRAVAFLQDDRTRRVVGVAATKIS